MTAGASLLAMTPQAAATLSAGLVVDGEYRLEALRSDHHPLPIGGRCLGALGGSGGACLGPTCRIRGRIGAKLLICQGTGPKVLHDTAVAWAACAGVIFGGGWAGSASSKRPAAISIPLRVACNGWAVYFVSLALTQRCDSTCEITIEGPINEYD